MLGVIELKANKYSRKKKKVFFFSFRSGGAQQLPTTTRGVGESDQFTRAISQPLPHPSCAVALSRQLQAIVCEIILTRHALRPHVHHVRAVLSSSESSHQRSRKLCLASSFAINLWNCCFCYTPDDCCFVLFAMDF